METTAVAIREDTQLMPTMSISDMMQVGKLFETCGMFGCKQEGQGFVIAMTCVTERISPIKFLEKYNLVGNRPAMRPEYMLSRLLQFGGTHEVLARGPDRAGIKCKFKDAEYTCIISIQEAMLEPWPWNDPKTKKDLKYNWQSPQQKADMLWARVISRAVRTVCPLATSGSYTPEELMDMNDNESTPSVGNPVSPQNVVIPTAQTQPEQKPSPPLVIEPEVVSPSAPPPQIDYEIIPDCFKQRGKRWSDMTDTQLGKFLAVEHDLFKIGHKDAINAEIERRNSKSQVQA